jgi:hypothetical protein
VLFLKYSLKRKIVLTGKKGAEVFPTNDITDFEKGTEEEPSTEEVAPSTR